MCFTLRLAHYYVSHRKEGQFYKAITQGQIYQSQANDPLTQAAKTKRHHRQNHERLFTERVFTPLNEQIDEDAGVVFYFSS